MGSVDVWGGVGGLWECLGGVKLWCRVRMVGWVAVVDGWGVGWLGVGLGWGW